MSRILFVVFLFVTSQCYSQTKRIDNLVFEGAGIRGLAYCGAITALEQNYQLQNVQRIAGTSAGAITALLLSLNYSSKEIETIIGSTNYKKFNDGGFPIFGGIRRIKKKYGWFKGDKFEKWLSHLIEQKTGNANITFEALALQYKKLYITGSSLNDQKSFLFSAESFPKMKVKDAVRISMSIPLYYQAILMDDDGNIYKKPIKNKNLHVMVDGGFLNNFPIEVFDSTKYLDYNSSNQFKINPYTIGCRIDSKSQIALDKQPNNKALAPIPIQKIGQYFNAFLVLNMERLSRQKLSAEDWERTISIEDGGIGPRVKRMPQKEINTLVENGFNATNDFLKKFK